MQHGHPVHHLPTQGLSQQVLEDTGARAALANEGVSLVTSPVPNAPHVNVQGARRKKFTRNSHGRILGSRTAV